MRADRGGWTLAKMNDLLGLAGVDKRGLVQKEELEALCERCLQDVAEGRLPAAASFLKSRYGGGAEGAADAKKPPPVPKGAPCPPLLVRRPRASAVEADVWCSLAR